MGRLARARLEFSGLYALRLFTSEVLRGSPCNPTLVIRPPPALEVKRLTIQALVSFQGCHFQARRPFATMIRYGEVEK